MESNNQNEEGKQNSTENQNNQEIKKEIFSEDSKIPKAILFLVIFLAIVGVVFAINKFSKNNDVNNEENDQTFWDNSTTTVTENDLTTTTLEITTTTAAAAIKKTTVIKKTTTPVKTPSTSLSATDDYLKARNIYQTSGYYFQFLNCRGTPGILTVKKGVKLMLDNRDDKMRKIVFIGKLYNVNAYGYVVVTADKLGKHYITCDGGGAAQITVQP